MKKLMPLLLLLLTACTHHHTQQMTIKLVSDSVSVKITGLDETIVKEINRDSVADWQSLIPVYRISADTAMKGLQKPQPGKYTVKDSAVIFTPDTPFIPHQVYYVRLYQYGAGNSAWDYIKSHKKPGKPQFVDLIFKQ